MFKGGRVGPPEHLSHSYMSGSVGSPAGSCSTDGQAADANLGAPGSTRIKGEPGRSQSRGGESPTQGEIPRQFHKKRAGREYVEDSDGGEMRIAQDRLA